MRRSISGRTLFFTGLIVALAACTIQTVPSYDAELESKLNDAHEKTLAVFSGLSSCPSNCAYSAYSDKYDELIGAFGAARDKAKARPTPPLGVRLAQSSALKKVCANSTPQDCLNTTPDKLELVVETLSELRDEHRAGPLQRGTDELFLLDYQAAIEPTLTIEAALNR